METAGPIGRINFLKNTVCIFAVDTFSANSILWVRSESGAMQFNQGAPRSLELEIVSFSRLRKFRSS